MTINYQPIFDYIDKAIEPLKADIKRVDDKIDTMSITMENVVTRLQNLDDDVRIVIHRTDGLEAWALKAGKKISLPFTR